MKQNLLSISIGYLTLNLTILMDTSNGKFNYLKMFTKRRLKAHVDSLFDFYRK